MKAHPLGYVNDEQRIVDVYHAADVFVLPSLSENLPNTIMDLIREYPHRNQILNSVPTYLGDKRTEPTAAGLSRPYLFFSVESPDLARSVLADFLAGRPLKGTVRRAPRSF